MTQAELNRAVARATGESIAEVKRIGFLLAEPDTDIPDPDDEDLGPSVLDWDEFDEMRGYMRLVLVRVVIDKAHIEDSLGEKHDRKERYRVSL